MSGPKVVRIVTREEIIALCEGHLARLEQAVTRWEAHASTLGQMTEQARAATRARQARLRALLTQEQFQALQKDVPIEIEYLRRDLQAREEHAVMHAAEHRAYRRRVHENATLLLHALNTRTDTPAPLLQAVTQLVNKGASDNAEQLLAQGFAHLAGNREPQPLSGAQQELAQRLKGAPPALDQAALFAQQVQAQRDPRLQQIDRHIAELQLLQGETCAAPFVAALQTAESQTQVQRRNLLLDSLVIELANSTRDFQLRRQALTRLQDLASEVQVRAATEHLALLEQISQCTTATALAELTTLSERCEAMLAAHIQAHAALARRQAMLQGLAQLGYEVREGMATAWAEAGRVVLRKAATPGYGVELGGKADNGRLQVRAVALCTDRDKQRDSDIEAIWCNEFERLQALLQAGGSELLIERALGVGEVPLKEADMPLEAAGEAAQPLTRSSP